MPNPVAAAMTDDPTFAIRLLLGVGVLATFLVIDLRRHGRNSPRLREYGLLATAAFAAMAYAGIHDLIAFQLSHGYFAFGKGLGSEVTVARAVLLGVQAGWSAGLVLGVALIIANNPGRRPQLPVRALFRMMPGIVITAATCAALGCLIGRTGVFDSWLGLSADDAAGEELAGFGTVWGMNLGAYLGGLIATIVAIVIIRRRRARITAPGCCAPS